MSRVKRTKAGEYRAVLDVRRNGRRYYRSRSFVLRREAQRWLTDQLAVLDRGEFTDAGGMTLEEWLWDVGDVLGLRWQDVSLDDGLLRVAQTLVMVGGSPQVSVPKTDFGLNAYHPEQRH